MNRRQFLGAIIASACAPAIVRASSLMPVREIAAPLYLGTPGPAQTIDWGESVLVRDWTPYYAAIGVQMRETLETIAYQTLTQ